MELHCAPYCRSLHLAKLPVPHCMKGIVIFLFRNTGYPYDGIPTGTAEQDKAFSSPTNGQVARYT